MTMHHTLSNPTSTTPTLNPLNATRPYRRMPLIKLGEHFTHIQDYLERVPNGIPDILSLEHLTVAGDVVFGANVTLKVEIVSLGRHCCVWRRPALLIPYYVVFVYTYTQGTVIIVANEGSVIMIPDGTVLEDKVVTGNLRILDH